MIYPVISIVENQPTFSKPSNEILSELQPGGALQTLTPLEYITQRQRNWYKGVVLPHLVKHDENKGTKGWWDTEVKRLCNGLALLKKQIFYLDDGQAVGRLTTKDVGKKNMTLFIEEILAKSVEKNWGISEPDPDLRKKKL